MNSLAAVTARRFLLLLVLLAPVGPHTNRCAHGQAIGASSPKVSKRALPESKQTVLGLYVTAKEAYEKWEAEPEKTKILDVRTPEEHIFVGHPEMAWSVPFAFQTYAWDSGNQRLVMEPNPGFISQVKEWFTPDDTLLIICRSGSRSARAVDLLAEAGFKSVYNIIDGMEGDKVEDPASIHDGKRMKNGWKNSGMPWTYRLHRERMRLPPSQ